MTDYQPPWVVYDLEHKSALGIPRLELHVEVHRFPLGEDELRQIVEEVIDEYGKGWPHAVYVTVRYDRREPVVSFAAFIWARRGQWSRASEGDPETSMGYELRAAEVRGKVTEPGRCSPPDEASFRLAEEFNRLVSRDPNADERATLQLLAEQHDVPLAEVEKRVRAVDGWCYC
ncbi:MAG TPA: hypothetical protein VHE80_05270 [Acidimicrobiales bacterium]|nr:hypothetical protein [Acidimicrobiales bacterium]